MAGTGDYVDSSGTVHVRWCRERTMEGWVGAAVLGDDITPMSVRRREPTASYTHPWTTRHRARVLETRP